MPRSNTTRYGDRSNAATRRKLQRMAMVQEMVEEEPGITVTTMAIELGVSTSQVSNYLRLLNIGGRRRSKWQYALDRLRTKPMTLMEFKPFDNHDGSAQALSNYIHRLVRDRGQQDEYVIAKRRCLVFVGYIGPA